MHHGIKFRKRYIMCLHGYIHENKSTSNDDITTRTSISESEFRAVNVIVVQRATLELIITNAVDDIHVSMHDIDRLPDDR